MHRRLGFLLLGRMTIAASLFFLAAVGCAETPAKQTPAPAQAVQAPAAAKSAKAANAEGLAPTVAPAFDVDPPKPAAAAVAAAPVTPATPAAPAVPEDPATIPAAFREPKGGWLKDFKTKYTKDVKIAGIDEPKDAHYDIWVPDKYDPAVAAPLVIVLHGGPGGKAIALASVLAMGLGDMGAISVYPQALRGNVMCEWNYPHEGAFILAIIKQVAQQYHIDPKRVYLMGHSMGGGGTWHNGAIMHDLWAGVAPLSGWYGAAPVPPLSLLKDVPTYIIHGDKDQNVMVQRSQMAVAEFKKMGKTDYVYKELAGIGHQEYLEKAPGKKELLPMVKWLLEKKRKEPADLDAAEKALAKFGKQFNWSPEGGALGHYIDPSKEKDEKPEAKDGAKDEAKPDQKAETKE